MRVRNALLLTAVGVVFTTAAWAEQCDGSGCFMITDVHYALETKVGYQRVMVGAAAKYEGTIESNDNSWSIQTNLFHNGEKTSGTPKSGGGIPADKRLTLEANQYGAFKDIADCDVNAYQGQGVVAIYHQFNPEIDSDTAPSQYARCQPSSSPPPQTETPTDQTTGDCNYEICSPILVDLDRGGFRLTSVVGGVRFDLNRDGVSDSLAWTERGSGDAWLALDRNGNGTVDDGGELFGNFTDQPATDAPHGYRALAVFDGDGDGRITPADAVFTELLLWSDRNHDGVSQPTELLPLPRSRIDWIGLEVTETAGKDRYGNELRYRALVGKDGATFQSVDVLLQGELSW